MGKLHDLYNTAYQQYKNNYPHEELFNQINSDNVNELDDNDQTLLHLACARNDEPLVSRLLELKANVTLRDSGGYSPLTNIINTITDTTSTDISKKIILKLLKNGANINETEEGTGYTYLHYAINEGNLAKVTILLYYGANVLQKNVFNQSAHFIALNSGKEKSKEILRLITNNNFIGFDLTGIELEPGSMDNKLVLFSTLSDQPITREVPNFSKAITNIDEFINALKSGATFNYEQIYVRLKQLIEIGNTDPKLAAFLTQIKNLWQTQTQLAGLKKAVTFYYANNPNLFLAHQQKRQMTQPPTELIDEIDRISLKLELKKPIVP